MSMLNTYQDSTLALQTLVDLHRLSSQLLTLSNSTSVSPDLYRLALQMRLRISWLLYQYPQSSYSHSEFQAESQHLIRHLGLLPH